MQTVENLDDALAEGSAPDDAVINDHEVVHPRFHGAESHVIDMSGQVVAAPSLGDESTQFNVLPHHLFCTHHGKRFALFHAVLADAVHHAVVSHLGGVGDVAEDAVFHVLVDALQNGIPQLEAQLLTLTVNVAVVATAEVDAFEGTGCQGTGSDDLLETDFPRRIDHQGLPRSQFLHLGGSDGECRLEHWTLAGHYDHFLVLIEEGRTDAGGVPHGEELPAAGEPAHHIAPIEVRHGGAQYIGRLHVAVDVVRDVETLQSLLPGFHKETLHLAVQTVSHQLQQDVRVTVDARILSLAGEEGKHIADVRHVEVAAETEVLGLPVVAAEEGMHIPESPLARGRVAQVSHVEFAHVRYRSIRFVSDGMRYLVIHRLKDLGDGILALRLLAVHVFMPRSLVQFHAGHSGTFLSPVVLLLHHQVQLLQGVVLRAVFLLIVFQWLEQANHGYATFMFQLFHPVNMHFRGHPQRHVHWGRSCSSRPRPTPVRWP